MKRVAVIGCGPTGLATLGHLSTLRGQVQVSAFERLPLVGGEWNYTACTDYSDGTRPSAMYNSLRMNSDKYCTAFPDFPFGEDIPCWPTHRQMKEYLQSYASHRKLEKYIKFRVAVEHVKPLTAGVDDATQWQVDYRYLETGLTEREVFDVVIVCSGIFQDPIIPEGIASYRGPYVHSCQYREPGCYKDKIVLVVGTGPSSCDITWEVASLAKRVYVSSRGERMPMDLPPNSEYVKAVQKFKESSVVLEDGAELVIEAILLCTGYRQNYSYLDPACHVWIRDGVTYPLYHMVVHPQYPTSFFFNGMVYIAAHSAVTYFTARVIGNILTGSASPPSRQLMERQIEEDFEKFEQAGQPPRNMLKLNADQDEYLRKLADLGNVDSIPDLPTFKEIVKIVAEGKFHLLRQHIFVLNEDGSCAVKYETK